MTDVSLPENLTERQQLLLSTLVQEFISDDEPVSSKRLLLTSGLKLSSATIRNEMAILEEKGFIRSPHTFIRTSAN